MPGVTALDVSEEVLSCFWDLAAIESDKRAEATLKLIDHLQKSQKDFVADENNQDENQGNLDAALSGCSPLVAYAVRRLYKGLTSGRKGARQGFALALTAALRDLDCFESDNIEALIASMNELAVGGGRDEFFGQLFGLGAVIRAQKLENAAVAAIAEQAVGLAHKKSFLREAAAALIIELAENNPDGIGEALKSSNELRGWLAAPIDQSCPEVLALALRLWRYMPKDLVVACHVLPSCNAVPSASLFTEGRKEKDKNDKTVASAFFSNGHLLKIASLLKATTHGHPRLNMVWPTMLTVLLPGYVANAKQQKQHCASLSPELVSFWTVLVEKDIFESASHDRKFLGFTLFGEIIAVLKVGGIADLLTQNFMHTLATNISKKDSMLRPAAQQCMDRLKAVVAAADADSRTKILLAVERYGNGFLVKTLNSQKVQESQESDADAVARVKQLKAEYDALAQSDDVEGTSMGRKKSVLGQLAGIAKRQQGGEALVMDIFKFLVDRGLFKGKSDDGSQNFDLISHCASLVISTADAVSRAQAMAHQRQKTSDGVAADGQADALEQVAAYVEKRASSKGTAAFNEPTEESKEAYGTLKTLRKFLEKLAVSGGAAAAGEAHRQAESLKHLVILLELHAITNPATADPALATDLEHVVSSVFPSKAAAGAGGKKKAKKQQNEEEDEIEWQDALVDIVLTIISRNEAPLPSAPLRDAAERLFKTFASTVTQTGVQDLLQIVMKPLDEKDDEEEEEEEDGSEGSDDEEMEDADEESEEDEDEDKESSDDVEADGSDDEDDAADSDSNDEDLDAMTDDQMFKMDAQLGAYFASMSKGKDTRKLRQEMISFKLRALACLEMVMKKVPESPLTVIMASPLLAALVVARKASGDNSLSERLAAIVRNQLQRCKPEASEDLEFDAEEMQNELKRTLYYASRSEDKVIQEAACAVFSFLLRAAFGGAEEVAQEYVDAAVDDFFTKKKTKLTRAFFQQLLRRLPEAAGAALSPIVQGCASARNEYIRQEAFVMLELAVKSADEAAAASALKKNSEALLNALLAAVNGPYAKKQRRNEALKAMCAVAQALESKKAGLSAVLGKKASEKVFEAVSTALDGSPKDPHLTRLAGFLESEAAAEEKPAPKAAGKKVVGKKRAAAPVARSAKK